jgi:hypothetical protein
MTARVLIVPIGIWLLVSGTLCADPPSAGKPINFDEARKHWAYQPVRNPALPEVRERSWPQTPVDYFLLRQMEEKGQTPAPPADRRTLIRRAYFDLIGLPPTMAEVRAFENDPSPDAFARVVDHLLASPHYGERWGRHWLDFARYADTKDLVLVYGKDAIRPYAYTYRDYVIRALNEDTPYNRFIEEQLAADQIQPKVEPWRLAAMGFLTLGRLFDNNLPDIYDDQIDTVGRGLLGLTIACARCHDHKYDAIPTADYYSLFGVFASSEVPLDPPLIADPKSIPGGVEFEKQLAAKRAELQKHTDTQYEQQTEIARQRTGDYLMKIAVEKPDPLETAVFFTSLSPGDLRPPIISRWRRYLERRDGDDPVFGPWHAVFATPQAAIADLAEQWKKRPIGTERGQINLLVRDALMSAKLTDRGAMAKAYGELFKKVYEESKKSAPTDTARKQLLAILTDTTGPVFFAKSTCYLYMSRVERDRYGSLVQELDKLAVHSNAVPPRAMVLTDAAAPMQPRILLRGNPTMPGPAVPRQFLQILSDAERRPFQHGSGRLDLAKAITSPDNPLTARVMVNRVWMFHFGEPLVSTPADFGTRSTPPSNPDLLDYLAYTFMQNGWSLKALHRRIMLSNAYQLASSNAERGTRNAESKTTASNSAFRIPHSEFTFTRTRLDFETMRDNLLFVSGRLDHTRYGRPGDAAGDPANRRRTIYGLVDRQNLPALYRAFDFAVPDQCVERRPQTTVPQQSLFAMNSPFMIEQVKSLASRPEFAAENDPARRAALLYQILFTRAPRPEEVELALRFLRDAEAAKDAKLTPWQQYIQVLLMTNELLFVD